MGPQVMAPMTSSRKLRIVFGPLGTPDVFPDSLRLRRADHLLTGLPDRLPS